MRSDEYVSVFKTSAKGLGRRHLQDGYSQDDFPGGQPDQDGCAYFARDLWIAELFASNRLEGYDDFVIEIRIPIADYEANFARFERVATYHEGNGCEVVIPGEFLALLNQYERQEVSAKEPTE